MEERLVREMMQRGRDFLKSRDTAELEKNGSDYKSDQEPEKAPAAPGEAPHDGKPN